MDQIEWDHDAFDLQFITLGRVGDNIRTREKEGPSLGPELASLADRCDLTLNDESDLNGKLREALSAGDSIIEPIRLRFLSDDNETPWMKLGSAHKRASYVGYVSGSEIAELYRPSAYFHK